MKKILLIGCGGIGSWLAHFIAFGRRNSLIHADITLADPDTVEPKNLLYSNFMPEDVGKSKAMTLSERYNLTAIQNAISGQEQLKPFSLVVIATDNGKSRSMVYGSGKPWIDLRCKGNAYAAFSGFGLPEEKKKMAKTIDPERQSDSCQYRADAIRNKAQFGNIIAASVGWQMILNWSRGQRSNKTIGII
jgi:hypothetical protein